MMSHIEMEYAKTLRDLAAAHEALSIANASADDQMFQKREAQAQRDKAIAFLHVYRNDTPLRNQPHMLAHEVDQFLKESGK